MSQPLENSSMKIGCAMFREKGLFVVVAALRSLKWAPCGASA